MAVYHADSGCCTTAYNGSTACPSAYAVLTHTIYYLEVNVVVCFDRARLDYSKAGRIVSAATLVGAERACGRIAWLECLAFSLSQFATFCRNWQSIMRTERSNSKGSEQPCGAKN